MKFALCALKPLSLAVCVVVAFSNLNAQRFTWEPSAGHVQVPIWPGAAPDQQTIPGPEYAENSDATFVVAGRGAVGVWNVSKPTMTVYAPKAKNTGVAVVIFPGGGYEELAIDLEGTEACDWLATTGITCVLLKYRVPSPRSAPNWGAYPQSKMALDDAQRTLGLVRLHAAEWGVDPLKVGVLGFSAGGHLVAATSTLWQKRMYKPVDAADQESCRPDFGVAIYPGHLSFDFPQLNPNVPVTKQTPPTFLLQAENDDSDTVEDSLAYYIALKHAGVPVEMHLYAKGGHAFGLRPTKQSITHWPGLVEKWLRTIGMIPQ